MDPDASRSHLVADDRSGSRDQAAPAILKADPAARRRVLAWVVVVTIVLGVTLYSVTQWIARVQVLSAVDAKSAARQLSLLTWATAAFASLTALGMAAVLVRLSAQVRRVGQYPLPGARVVRDTPVRTGEQARRMAAISLVLAVMLVIAAIAVIATAWSLWRLLVR